MTLRNFAGEIDEWVLVCDSGVYYWSGYLLPLVVEGPSLFPAPRSSSLRPPQTPGDANLSYGLGKLDRLRN